jgi:hypothetical protein
MDSDNVTRDQSADRPSSVSIPVTADRIDQLITIARDLAGIVLILDAAGSSDPAFAAIERFLTPINEQVQEFKKWFHHAWHVVIASTDVK